MIFPALQRYLEQQRDPEARLYAYLRGHLNFTKPKPVKGWTVARALKIDIKDVRRHLNALVAKGFLNEWPRDSEKDPRMFTLVWDEPDDAR